MGFSDSPIINSPFERPRQHYELDGDGQPTGKKLPDRRESIYVVPVPAARRRGLQHEMALDEETKNVLVNANSHACRSMARSAARTMGRDTRDAAPAAALA